MQHKNSINRKILDLLMLLENTHGLSLTQIAEEISVKVGTLYKVKGDSQNGSELLFKALTLLIENRQLKEERRLAEIAEKIRTGSLTAKEKAALLNPKP